MPKKARKTAKKVNTPDPNAPAVRLYPSPETVTFNTDDLLKNRGLTLLLYQTMAREPYIKAALAKKKLMLAGTPWRIQAASTAPADVDAARFLSWALDNMKTPLAKALYDALDALDCGVSYLEIVPTYLETGPWAGYVGLDSLRPWDPLDMLPSLAPDRTLTSLRILPISQDIPAARFLVHRYLAKYMRHYGESDLRAAYRAFFIKDTAWKLRSAYMERYAVNVPKITYEADTAGKNKKAALDVLASWKTTSGIALPKGMEADILAIATSSRTEFEAAIADCNREILIGILGSHLTAEEGRKTGSQNAGQVQKEGVDDWVDFLEAMLREDIRTQLFTTLTAWNFPDATPPKLRFAPRGKDLKTQADIDSVIIGKLGVIVPDDYWYDTYGYPVPEQGESTAISTAISRQGDGALGNPNPLPSGKTDPNGGTQNVP